MTLTIKRCGKHNLFFMAFTFFLLFSPPILGIHSLFFVAGFSWIYILCNIGLFFQTIDSRNFVHIFLCLLLLSMWAALLVYLNDGTRAALYHYIYWIVSIFPGSITLSLHARKYNEDLGYILNLILWAAFIQSLISIAAFVNNDFKMLLINELQSDDTLVTTTYVYEIYYRLFGYSAGLTFDMPSAMSMIACIAIYLGINKDLKYLFFVPTIVFSAMINARTSVVVLAIGVFVLLTMNRRVTAKRIERLMLILLLLVGGILVGISMLRDISPLTFRWVSSGLEQLLEFFKGNTNSGYFEYLVHKNRWRLPSGIFFLFGTGSRVIGGSKYGVFSDVGYINDLWFGGLFYTITLYSLVIALIWKVYIRYGKKNKNGVIRFICITYLLCLPILNIKTFIVAMGAFTTIFIIVSMHCYIFKNELE